MITTTMSAMQHTTQELQSHIQAQSVPQPPQNVNFHELAMQLVQQVPSLDPSQTHLATFLATLQIKADHESKLARHLLEKSLMTTVNTVNSHTQELSHIKQTVDTVQLEQSQLHKNQDDIYAKLAHIQGLASKAYFTAAETKQRASKGNFIVQGDGIPPYTPSEDLYAKVFPLIHEKYDLYVHPNELTALHRLPNNKVLFSLGTRLPGQNFEKFCRLMNSNPKPNIRVFVTVQLCELYAELYYISRRLKHYKVISNYRLDENGGTQVALSPSTQSFKFTGLDQLESLEVVIPPQIHEEIRFRRAQIQQNEEKSRNLNLEKARKTRPNPPPPFTGANNTPVVSSRAPPPIGQGTTQASSSHYFGSLYHHPPEIPAQYPNNFPRHQPVTSASAPSYNQQPSRTNTNYTQSYRQRSPPTQSYQTNSSHHTNQDLRSKAVKRPNTFHPSQVVTPPGSKQFPQTSFRFPPPRQNQSQSPQFPYPQSYWTTPPPGVEVCTGGAGGYSGGNAVAGPGIADTRSRVTQSSDIVQQVDYWMEEMNY